MINPSKVAILALTMLLGEEGKEYCYLEGPKDDPQWWVDYSKLHRN